MDNPDCLIVGGGSAGATLAARLSEDPGRRVLLIEAGPDTPPGAVPADIADTFPTSSLATRYFWPGLRATRRPGGATYPFPQARVMGGGSSVMGLWTLRGLASDFAAWERAGADGWSFAEARRLYRAIEHDGGRDAGRNGTGRYSVRRMPRAEWPAYVAAMERAAHARGLATIEDINEAPGDGFFPMPIAQDDQVRSTSAGCYLTAEVRRRRNLAILTDAQVTALRFDGRRACGVTLRQGGTTRTIAAREVILCAGAIHSPALLLRAGIGPAEDIAALGIAVLADRRGVGANLQNHPYLQFALTLPKRARMPARLRRFAVAGLRVSSGLEGCPPCDLLAFAIGRVSPFSYGPDLGMVGAALYAPFSRGRVALQRPDPETPPAVDFSLLQDPRDPPRLLQAARLVESLLADPGVAAAYGDAFLLPPVMSLQQFNQPGFAGALRAAAIKAIVNAPPPLARLALNRALAPGRFVGNRTGRLALPDEELLAAAAPMAHPSGTCAIGRADDPMAVVDPHCRVHGIAGLRVVDASVMPTVPSANTNLTAIIVAERAAELIESERR
ncbi:GMC family oxidoreductase [Rhodoplanes roseus]|uniref:Choline dehydrogenase n=1 Tax=Rhodoplanes roseus TaxID=29409 RepID=A0A327L6H4_9BRAD|nr:FAD-dependent oxidoreductase [Rhodoplanes roseus]RAI45122.1 choline dehydrogenase [Rhodoplanes roseus]